jgi:hypothetical protein
VAAKAWRVEVQLTTDIYYMDIVVMAHGKYLEKLRITRCTCNDPVPRDALLHSGEQAALDATADRLSTAS